jgi:drug/metabolite transporter (DMT)-like permease
VIAPWRISFVLLSVTWGSSFLFIKVLDEHWPALWIAFGRVALGAVTLTALTRIRGERLTFDRRAWRDLAIAGALVNAIPFTLFAFGEKHVSSVAAGLWNATTPLWVLVIVVSAFPEERLTRRRGAGLVLGFVGALVVLGPWRVHHGQLIGELACAGAALCYGLGFPYTRRYLAPRSESSLALSAGQLLCATALLALTIPFAGAPTAHIGLDGLGSLLALGVFGSGIAYLLNYAVVRAAGAAIASTVTYLIPIVSTLLGVVVLGEALSWNQPIGAAVLLIGIALSQGALQRATPSLGGTARQARDLG